MLGGKCTTAFIIATSGMINSWQSLVLEDHGPNSMMTEFLRSRSFRPGVSNQQVLSQGPLCASSPITVASPTNWALALLEWTVLDRSNKNRTETSSPTAETANVSNY